MKYFLILFFSTLLIISCDPSNAEYESKLLELEHKMEKIESQSKRGLGSMMNEVQVYHTKLFYAAKLKNIELMKYILHELEEVFEDVITVHKDHDGIKIDELAGNTVLPSLKEFEQLLESDDTSGVMQSYDNLTVNCNKCHAAANHDFIVIQTPTAETFLNQRFNRLE